MKNCYERSGFSSKQVDNFRCRLDNRSVALEDLEGFDRDWKIAKLPGPDNDHLGIFLIQKGEFVTGKGSMAILFFEIF